MGELERLYYQYKDRVDFHIVYVREAHPSDGWQVNANKKQGIEIEEPKTEKERHEVANLCKDKLKISIPIIVDSMDNKVEIAYAAWPDRIYIIGKDGIIRYQGKPGPAGFKPTEAEEALKKILDNRH